MSGHVHQTLELPQGYQHFGWYRQGVNPHGVWLNSPRDLKQQLKEYRDSELRLYTQHEIFYEEGVLKHTRSSPNWDGGFVTYATCKHLMRTYKRDWVGTWLAGLCPAHCENNTMLFVGRVNIQRATNYDLGLTASKIDGWAHKQAVTNPRGDLYLPLKTKNLLSHTSYSEPPNHTRSVEFYKRSPGSVSNRKDGKIPKWWRDIEYIYNGYRPPSFILSPCFLFSRPMVWTSYTPRRAVLKLTCQQFLQSLTSSPKE